VIGPAAGRWSRTFGRQVPPNVPVVHAGFLCRRQPRRYTV